jgi:rubrerythrin
MMGAAVLLDRLPPVARSAPSEAQDQRILNFALLLEELQAAFYGEALARKTLAGDVRAFASTVRGHEREHVAFLRKALGPEARGAPDFHFGTATSDQRKFIATAILLEDTAVAAYNGQAANLTKAALASAIEIVSVEGRHAAWIRDLAGDPPAPRAADPGQNATQVVRTVRARRFL